MLNPFDAVLLLRLCLQAGKPWTYAEIAAELKVSESQCHRSFNRLVAAGLVLHGHASASGSRVVVFRRASEFLLHGVKYCFYPVFGAMSRGMPTGVAGPPLADQFILNEGIPVWPDAEGSERGEALMPFYPAQPAAARANPRLYELLCLLDALRAGRARERALAEKELLKHLKELEGQQHERRAQH